MGRVKNLIDYVKIDKDFLIIMLKNSEWYSVDKKDCLVYPPHSTKNYLTYKNSIESNCSF
jgi:hypothetical protein